MSDIRIAPLDTWPDLRVTFHLLPWTWHLRPDVYADDVDGPKGHCSFRWLFLDIEWWGNQRLFTEVVPLHNAQPWTTTNPQHFDGYPATGGAS